MPSPFVPTVARSGTVKIETCNIINMATQNVLDIRSIARRITICNSLDVMTTSGWLEVLDQGNAIEEYSMNGQEILDISITLNADAGSSDLNSYKRRFLVYGIENIAAMKDQMVYKILFIDPFALMNTDTRISWHFKNVKGEDIIKKIGDIAQNAVNAPYRQAMSMSFGGSGGISSSQGLFDFKADVSTQHELDIYVPMMKPFELIRYLADRVVSSGNQSDGGDNNCSWSDCVFYQDKNGKFHLNSFKNLFKNGSPITLSQQIADNATQEKQHLIESYSFNKIYNIQVDKLNGIYGVQYAIADFKPSTKKATQQSVLGTSIMATSGIDQKNNSLSLRNTIARYFDNKLGPFSLSDDGSSGGNEKAGFIRPWQCNPRQPPLQSVQTTGEQPGQQKQAVYENQAGALIFLDACGIIHEDDNTYNEYKRVALPYVNGCIMKKVLSSYVINVVMNGAFDMDVGRSFVIKLDKNEGPKQMAVFVGDVIWVISDVKHEWRADTMEMKTYVTGFSPFLRRGEKFTNVKK